MWIFLNNAFFSAVEDVICPENLAVRARVSGDLEKIFDVAEYPVTETVDSDYRFRIFIPKIVFAEILKQKVLEIKYTNFKNSIPLEDKDRYLYYTRVWTVMATWQDKFFGSMYNTWYKTYPKTHK